MTNILEMNLLVLIERLLVAKQSVTKPSDMSDK